jgi:hypothetical protein
MVRRHIEFVQTATLPWRQPVGAWRPAGVLERVLSVDGATEACTAEWRLPEGWDHPPGHWRANIEIFILEGELSSGDLTLREHTYAYIPAGVNPGRLSCRHGCRLLWMPDGRADFTPDTGHRDGAPIHRYIAAIDTAAVPWTGTITPGFPPGAMRKTLRIDPETGASTWLLGVLPQWRETRIEIHPVSEEAYQLQGEIVGDRGTFAPGCYFWRPPHVPHGPFATRTGSLTFFRTEGPLVTYYVDPAAQGRSTSGEGAA